jgi:hypothetical protein
MMEDVQKEKSPLELNQMKMEELSMLVKLQIGVEETIADYEEELVILNERLRMISEIKIPDIFDELGFDKVKLKSGQTVEIKRGYAATITEENRTAAFDWLKNTNNDGIIKHDVTVKLKKGESEDHKKIVEFIKKEGLSYEDKEHVHPATLKSFVNEQITNGVDFPMDTFKVFPIRKTKIKE